jgi:membrane-bound serine protease (ClpP class)
MRRWALAAIGSIALLAAVLSIAAPGATIPVLRLDGPIGPASAEYVARGLAGAAEAGAPMVVIRIDTPGGLAESTRDIVREILASRVPVATWVGPSGARAASAGTFIVMASHVAAMAPATNIGAATPVSIGGGPSPAEPRGTGEASGPDAKGDERGGGGKRAAESARPEAGGAMERKILNDSAAWIRALAQSRGRNVDWAERAVREGLSLSATEALENGVVDVIAADLASVVAAADGRKVRMADGSEATLAVAGATTSELPPDWRLELLMWLSNPTVAYMLLLVGAYGIFLEVTSPGFGVLGIVGAVMVLTGLFGLQMLPLDYAGVALLVLGFALVVAEVFVPSFGLLGLVGTIAFVIGSIMLIDTDAPGFGIPLWLIVSIAAANLVVALVFVRMALAGRRRPVASGAEELLGSTGRIIDDGADGAWARVHGERWRVRSSAPLALGQRVRVVRREGLVLDVEPLADAPPRPDASARPSGHPGP